MACESDFQVQNEYAVRCSIVSKPVYVIEYVKAISTLVGASHILAVFEENDYIKVFFDDKRCVDNLVRNCLHVLGRHVNVDYVVPPGAKLILSNVDPVITNYDIMRLLSAYGTVVSPVIRPPISDDIELCHISYGVRFVYIILSSGCIPEKIEFRYGDHLSAFQVMLAENSDSFMVPCIKPDIGDENHDEIECNSRVQSRNSVPGPSDTEVSDISEQHSDPVLVSVQSVPPVNLKEQAKSFNDETPNTEIVSQQLLSSEIIEPEVAIIKKRRGRPPVASQKRSVAVSHAARRIKNAKKNWFGGYKRAKYRSKVHRRSCNNHPVPSNTIDDMPDLIKFSELDDTIKSDMHMVLSNNNLLKFIEDVKGHRAPLELARKYIGQDCDSVKVSRLIDQLNSFRKGQRNINLKNRIWRLNNSLLDALNSETADKD